MGFFSDLSTTGIKRLKDSASTESKFGALETDIYTAKIKVAYAGESANKARTVTVIYTVDGQEFTETFYVTSRKGDNFIQGDSSSEKTFLPGFQIVEDMCQLSAGISLVNSNTEIKNLSLYNFKEGKKVPTPVNVLTELTGAVLKFAIIKQLRNKMTKQGDSYVALPDTKEVNKIVSVFDPKSDKTANEQLEKTEAKFYNVWLETNKGKVVDAREIKSEVNTSTKSGSEHVAEESTTRTDIFDD